MPDDFEIDPRLVADSRAIGDLPLSSLLLARDSRFLWVIMVPRVAGMRDLIDLSAHDQARLTREIDQVGRAVRDRGEADKLNIASLGNQVEQLHVHMVARRRGDPAWPMPIWGVGEPVPYADDHAARVIGALRDALGL